MKKILLLLLLSTAAYSQPNIGQPSSIYNVCDIYGNGLHNFDLTLLVPEILGGLSNEEYAVTFHEISADAEFGINKILNPSNYTNVVPYSQTIFARLTEIANEENYATTSFEVIVTALPMVNIVNAVVFDTDGTADEITTIDLTYYNDAVIGESEEAIVMYYENNTLITEPTAYITGTQSINVAAVSTLTGCASEMATFNIVILPEDYQTPAPEGESTYNYTAGETLTDIPVEGENIQWYETETGDTPLPSTTFLSHNTTYYAAQTVYNIESSERLAVTVFDILLSSDSKEFASISHYPNPVNDILNISSNDIIENAVVTNMLGQEVMSKDTNSTNPTINLSGLGKGVYFVKLKAGSKEKTLKIVKE